MTGPTRARVESLQDLAQHDVEHVTVDPNIAIVAVVGENMRGIPGIAGKTFSAWAATA